VNTIHVTVSGTEVTVSSPPAGSGVVVMDAAANNRLTAMESAQGTPAQLDAASDSAPRFWSAATLGQPLNDQQEATSDITNTLTQLNDQPDPVLLFNNALI
jgi:hypothetical protein